MSLTTIFIGLAHGIPVFIAAGWGWFAMTVAAVISGIVAVSFGGPQFLIYDIAGISVAYIFCWFGMSKN